jgi:hypothetical protein
LKIKPLGKEYYSFLKGFFALYKTKKISGLNESISRDTTMYIPDKYRV